MPFTNQTEEKQIERAVLVGLSCPSFNTDQDADERTMDELRALAETAGAEAVAMTLQRRPAPDARTFIGEGKAEEVKQLAEMNDASLILFDNELSPSQMSQSGGADRPHGTRPFGAHPRYFRAACAHRRGQAAGRAGAVPVHSAASGGYGQGDEPTRRRHRHARTR